MILAAPLKKLRHFESELDIREIVCEKHAFQKVQIMKETKRITNILQNMMQDQIKPIQNMVQGN